jgi:hypothetical protein
MKKVKVELTGITPLLMNNPKSMIDKSMNKEVKQTTEKYDLEGEAKKLAYVTDEGELYVPAEAIKGALINAASYKKIEKYAAKPIIAGGVFILTPQILLNTKKYDLDVRTVVIQRMRVVKGRPMIKNWKLSFEMSYNEKLIQRSSIIKDILIEAGQRIGILDFRPQKNGSFGMFEVTKWQEQ